MSLIVPAPPGEAVGFDDSRPRRIAAPATQNLFVVGTFDRGTVGQFADPSGLRTLFGPRVNYSPAVDEINTLLAEGGATVTAARAFGADAVKASVTIDTKLKFSASSPGAWGNALKVQTLVPAADTCRVVVTEGTAVVDTSPTVSTAAELLTWAAQKSIVEVTIVGAGLPAATAATALTGGDDDLANIGPDDYAAALALLDYRYGPGTLIAPGVTDLAVHGKIIEHCAATNRVAELELPLDVTESQAITHRQALAADYPDDAWRVALHVSNAYAEPISGEPERLVGWAAVQAGIASYVEGRYGIGAAPFGLRRGVASTVTRLAREWSTGYNPPGEVQRLYAEHINAAVDNGTAIYLKGYRTLDGDPMREDMHVARTRMRLAWRCKQRAETYLGESCDRSTLAEFHADAIEVCKEFAKARAFNTDGDVGFRVETQSLNTDASLFARELHGRIRFRPNGSTHWVDMLVGSIRPTEQI